MKVSHLIVIKKSVLTCVNVLFLITHYFELISFFHLCVDIIWNPFLKAWILFDCVYKTLENVSNVDERCRCSVDDPCYWWALVSYGAVQSVIAGGAGARLLLETLHQEFISLQPVTQPSHPAQHSEQDIAQQLHHQQQQRSEHQQQSTTSTWEPWVERSSSKIFVMYVTFCILSINSIVNQCKMFCCDLSKIEFNENQNR